MVLPRSAMVWLLVTTTISLLVLSSLVTQGHVVSDLNLVGVSTKHNETDALHLALFETNQRVDEVDQNLRGEINRLKGEILNATDAQHSDMSQRVEAIEQSLRGIVDALQSQLKGNETYAEGPDPSEPISRVDSAPDSSEDPNAEAPTNTESDLPSTTPLTTAPQASSKYAYAYVVGGVKPEEPVYRFYFYNIVLSTDIQRADGSTADVVVFVQMSFSSEHRELPEADLKLLQSRNIIIKYIPSIKRESYLKTQFDKFRILDLVEYDRVLYLDSDVTPRRSLDYFFDLSAQGQLKENVVLRGTTEPVHGGFFMLQPQEGDHARVLQIIDETEARNKLLPFPHWNETLGWGATFPEPWILLTGAQNTTWFYHGSFADQGLLHYWTHFVKKSFSIVESKTVEHWGPGMNTSSMAVKERTELLSDVFLAVDKNHSCWKGQIKFRRCAAPHSDTMHYTGKNKPWMMEPPNEVDIEKRDETQYHFWFHHFSKLNDELDLGFDLKNWTIQKRPLLGLWPKKPVYPRPIPEHLRKPFRKNSAHSETPR